MLISKATFERLEKLIEKAQNRDPDALGLYIYNDFYGYAILDLVDESLSSSHTFVVKKKWLDSWHVLNALNELMRICPEWQMVDDGERVIVTDRVYGALIVTTMRGLAAASLLDEAILPDLESTLRRFVISSENDSSEGQYGKVLKGYGRKLFGTRTREEREQRVVAQRLAYGEFVKGLGEEERVRRGDRLPGEAAGGNAPADDDKDDKDDDQDEEEKDNAIAWYGDATAQDAEYNHTSFRITPAWKEYKSKLAGIPHAPLHGPLMWDLTKWSAAEKQEFSLQAPP